MLNQAVLSQRRGKDNLKRKILRMKRMRSLGERAKWRARKRELGFLFDEKDKIMGRISDLVEYGKEISQGKPRKIETMGNYGVGILGYLRKKARRWLRV